MTSKIITIWLKPTSRDNPRNCLHETEAFYVFEALTPRIDIEKELAEKTEELKKFNMWVHNARLVAPNTYSIVYGYDSGD